MFLSFFQHLPFKEHKIATDKEKEKNPLTVDGVFATSSTAWRLPPAVKIFWKYLPSKETIHGNSFVEYPCQKFCSVRMFFSRISDDTIHFSDSAIIDMASLLFKCIPCTRRGRMSLTDDKHRTYESRRVVTTEPFVCQMADVRLQSNAPINRARGFEEIGMGTVDYDTTAQTDTKKWPSPCLTNLSVLTRILKDRFGQ